LATWQPADPRWKVHVPTIADHLTRINPFEAEVFARSLRPVRDVLLPELRARYVEAHRRVESEQLPQAEMFAEFARCELTAGLLARWVDDRPADLADAAVIVADRHYPLLAEAVAANRDALVPLLLAELDCRPGQDWEAVAAGRLPTDTPLAAALGSAAERSITLPDEQVVQCHRRRANAAAVLFTLGRIAAAWPLLVHTADPTVRSHLIARLAAVGADPAELARRYAAEPDVSVRRAVLLALGDFPPVGGAFTAALLADYAAHRDPGVHSALGWLLGQKWGMAAEVAAIDARLRAPATAPISHGWLVNEEGQTFAVVRAPLEVRVGSPVTEWRRMDAREPARRECLDRSFAVATREVTVAEYRRFRHWHPPNPFNDNDPLSPVVTVSWYDAAAYCNWLSLRDGIDLAEWCYEMTDGAKAMWAAGQMFGPAVAWCRDQRGVGKGYKPRPDHLLKKGYRLPTETEWEAVARAGADTARPFGRGTSLLPRYAWFDRNAGRRTHPVGRLWPNDRGLFDTLGNAWEWCDDAAVLDEPGRTVTSDRGTGDPDRRVFRGGSFFDDFGSLRCANRNSYLPGEGYYTLGFRPVRTIP
jgi:formylglycine-generating enzyme required for sulfatase activity